MLPRTGPGTNPPIQDHPIIFYDGVCGMCNRFVRAVLRNDTAGRFRFATLQSDLARRILLPECKDPADLDTVCIHDGHRVLVRGDAVLYVLHEINAPWFLRLVLNLLRGPLLDVAYQLVARYRYPVFGRYDACPLPDPRWRDRFLE